MTRITDATFGPAGHLYILTDDGSIVFQDPEIGVAFQNMPASARPKYLLKTLEPAPPSPPVKLLADNTRLIILGVDGRLWERLGDRTSLYIKKHIWQEVTL